MHQHDELLVLLALCALVHYPLLLRGVYHAVASSVPLHEPKSAGVERTVWRLVRKILAQRGTTGGTFAKYADPAKRKLESGAFARAMEAKHAHAR